jgi:tRNA (pseudouridine54-N1)-methyltransferase
MREFLVVGHDAPTTPDFSLEDLPGGAGRLDLLCRCVTDGLLTSHGVREDARVHLVLGDAFTLTFDGAAVRQLHPDERSTAARIRAALERREDAIGHQPVEPSPGVSLVRKDFETTLAVLSDRGTPIQLHAEGAPVTDAARPDHPVFVLSDHREFAAGETDALASAEARRVSLGPRALHANQAITVAHNWLDTDGFSRY